MSGVTVAAVGRTYEVRFVVALRVLLARYRVAAAVNYHQLTNLQYVWIQSLGHVDFLQQTADVTNNVVVGQTRVILTSQT